MPAYSASSSYPSSHSRSQRSQVTVGVLSAGSSSPAGGSSGSVGGVDTTTACGASHLYLSSQRWPCNDDHASHAAGELLGLGRIPRGTDSDRSGRRLPERNGSRRTSDGLNTVSSNRLPNRDIETAPSGAVSRNPCSTLKPRHQTVSEIYYSFLLNITASCNVEIGR